MLVHARVVDNTALCGFLYADEISRLSLKTVNGLVRSSTRSWRILTESNGATTRSSGALRTDICSGIMRYDEKIFLLALTWLLLDFTFY